MTEVQRKLCLCEGRKLFLVTVSDKGGQNPNSGPRPRAEMPLLPYVPSIILTETVNRVLQLCGKCDSQPCKELAVDLCVFIYRDCSLDERKFI